MKRQTAAEKAAQELSSDKQPGEGHPRTLAVTDSHGGDPRSPDSLSQVCFI